MRLAVRSLLPLLLSLASSACVTADRGTAAPLAAQAGASAPRRVVAAAPADGSSSLRLSDDPVVQSIIDLGRTDNRVHAHLDYLTNAIGPRLTGSHALGEAEQWCVEQFRGWGLDARREQWGSFPVGFDRGPWSGRMVTPLDQTLEFTTPAWTPGAYGPVRGRVMLAPTTVAEAKKRPERFSGAWILQPSWKDDKRPEKTRDKIDGVLREATVAGFIRTARSDKGLVHTSGRYDVRWTELPSDVQVVLRADQFTDLQTRVRQGETVEVEFSIDNRFYRGPIPQYNVVADIKGSQFPDEYVIVGGHLDSWDGATGANDNGTGVSTTLEAARLLMAAGARPKRTIRFMLWSGEEQGLLGSTAYVEQNPDLMPKVSAVLVHDGGTNYLSGLSVTPEMFATVSGATEVLTRLDPKMPFEVELAHALQPGGSDHSPFIRAGVPGFFWNQAGESDYQRVHHTQFDVYGETREDYQRHSAVVVAVTALALADLPEPLDRTNSAPIPRRQMGVDFEGQKVTKLEAEGKARGAGWKVGDIVTKVDGVAIERRWDIVREMQKGGPKKTVTLLRGSKTVETVLDFSDDPAEAERSRRMEERRAAGLPLPDEK